MPRSFEKISALQTACAQSRKISTRAGMDPQWGPPEKRANKKAWSTPSNTWGWCVTVKHQYCWSRSTLLLQKDMYSNLYIRMHIYIHMYIYTYIYIYIYPSFISQNSFSYRGSCFKYGGVRVRRFFRFVAEGCRAGCRPRCRLTMCMGKGSQILIRFGKPQSFVSITCFIHALPRHPWHSSFILLFVLKTIFIFMFVSCLLIIYSYKDWNLYILNRLNKQWLIAVHAIWGLCWWMCFFLLLPIQWWFAQMLSCMAGWNVATVVMINNGFFRSMVNFRNLSYLSASGNCRRLFLGLRRGSPATSTTSVPTPATAPVADMHWQPHHSIAPEEETPLPAAQ